MLDVDVEHAFGAFALAARFTCAGRVTALFGPSGAGKTSLVNAIAGLLRPRRGRIVVDDQLVLDTRARVFVPPHRRRVGYVFQEARLFPHLSVRHNLDYGRWFAPARERRTRRDDVIELLGIGHLLGRRPHALSGGEKQRVAIGRALLANPRLLLLDEPLASIDEARKAEIVPYFERLRDGAGMPIVYVSHSLAEVARLAHEIVVVEGGKVRDAGPLASVLGRLDGLAHAPQDDVGAVLKARVVGHDADYGLTTLRAAAGELHVARLDLDRDAEVRLYVRARDVMLALEPPRAISALNVLPATVTGLRALGHAAVHVTLDCAGEPLLAVLTRRSAEALALRAGMRVYAVIKTAALQQANPGA
jgi:molybdate transport system ATP-binding protein